LRVSFLSRIFREGKPGASAASSAPTFSQIRATPLDETMMRRALELAREAAALGEVPVGAIVYETASARVLGEGYNRREIDHDPAAHAELIAIRAAARTLGDWRLNSCTLVVTLEPCAMCAGLIVNARVGRLVYGARDPKAGASESLYRLTSDPRLNHRVDGEGPIAGVMEDECAAILKDFFRGLRARRG
jgi:tRNA(Arg) A34 adenosine deaminase TadA